MQIQSSDPAASVKCENLWKDTWGGLHNDLSGKP